RRWRGACGRCQHPCRDPAAQRGPRTPCPPGEATYSRAVTFHFSGREQDMHPFAKGTVAALAASALAVLAVPAAAQFGGPPAPPNTGVPVFAPLQGALGSGNATVVIDPPKGTLCYM